MNDKTIINIISKIYFAIVSFFIFTFLLLFTLFVVLQNGVFIEDISTKQIQVKQLYIKWNERVDISIKEIHLAKQESKTDSKIDYPLISKYINSLSYTRNWFNSILIEKISYEDINASFHYKDLSEGFLLLSSEDMDLNASISVQPDIIKIKLKQFNIKNKDIKADGNIYISTKELKIYTDIDLKLVKEADLTFKSIIGTEDLKYRVISNKKITSIKNLIHLAQLPKSINFWAYDAIKKMSYVKLDDIYGYIDYNHAKEAYKNIYINATVYDADYMYNPLLDAIHASKIELEFTHGVFNIRPINAYSYGMFLNKSWLKIDFTKKEELLTLYLLFKAKLNKDVLSILNAYKIKLPFLQRSGEVDTDLKLEIGLRNIDINVKGKFYTKKANFDYIGLNIDIEDATILLNNYDVSIKKMKARYKEIAEATVSVKYDAKKAKGDIDFQFNKIALNDFQLKDTNQSLHAQYHINQNIDSIEVEKSQWIYKDEIINIDALSIPFDIDDTKISFPATFVTLPNFGNAFVSGFVNRETWYSELDVDILKLAYGSVQLTQSNTPIKVIYDDKLTIKSKNDIHFSVSGSKYKAKNLLLELCDNIIYLKHTYMEIGKYITTKVYAKYDLTAKKAHISLSDFILKDPNTHKLLYKNKKILLSAHIFKDVIKIKSLELNAKFTLKKSGWKLVLNSLNTIAENSSLLKQLQINDGEFTLYKYNKDKYTRFRASIKYPYKILVKKNIPIEKYSLNGKIYKEKVFIEVNNNLTITMKDTMKIDLKKSTVNLPEVIRAVKELNTTANSDQNTTLNIIVEGHNSQLYISKERSMLYDTLEVQYYDKILTAQLVYDGAKAGLKFADDEFHIYGKNFNDKFMNKLFSLSKFDKGKLNFAINGKIDNYDGVFFIKNTTIKEYKVLNNILAFINTVPSLITFSVPGYNRNGIFVKNAYIKFTSKNNNFTLNDIFLDSKELDILGRGNIDVSSDKMDIILNLKTDLGSELSKIPLVGYIILGEDTISTTLSMKGKLDNPTIKSLIATDIIVAPLNIIKRTLLLPYDLLKKKKKKKK